MLESGVVARLPEGLYLQAMFIISPACLLKRLCLREREREREGRILLQVHSIHSCVASLQKLISSDDVMFLISHGRERGKEGGII